LREGAVCGNGRDDSIILTLWGFHHITAAALMFAGTYTNSPNLWRHGYLLETGYEIGDLLSIALPMYPYRNDNVKPEMFIALTFHHLPGILLSPFVMSCGIYKNVHLQMIGLWLLAGAGFSCFVAVLTYAVDFNKQMKLAAAMFCSNTLFFLYSRWYIFPSESFALLKDTSSDPNQSVVLALLRFGGLALTIFNIGIASDILPKAIRYIKRAIDGETPIETKPIPSSRDSILFKRSLQNEHDVPEPLLLEEDYDDSSESDINDDEPTTQYKDSDSDRTVFVNSLPSTGLKRKIL
jgi:hypothetical protein